MLNINEEDLKAAIVQKAADEILTLDTDLSGLIAEEVRKRLDQIFTDRAEAQIQQEIDAAIRIGFEREFQRVDHWGEANGPKTTIRAELTKLVSTYWSAPVDPRTGKESSGTYNTVTRAEYLMTTICAKDFSEGLKATALNVTGHLKDGLRNQVAKLMDEMLNGLFHVKSLQDQGKVEKPY